jgi:hypothetical protein
VDPLPPVPPADVFEGIGGYRFLPASPRLRERTERRFNALLGTKLHAVALKRAKPDEPKRRRERGPVPPELVVLVLSFDLQPGETVEGFHSEVTDTLAEAIGVTEVRLGGRPAYLTKDATPRHQSRVFFFFEETVVVQVFGRLGAAKDLAAKLNGSR